MLAIPMMDAWLKGLKPHIYDDMVDRLNYYYTAFILLFFAVMVSAKQYLGSPIQCWVPAQFKGGWEQYTEDYCFIQNTYHLPFDRQIPERVENREEREIGYYQWVPIVLAIQALLFFLPNLVWKLLCWQSGINLKTILKSAADSSKSDPDKREKQLTDLARYIEDALGLQREIGVRGCRGWLCVRWGKHLGSYVSYLYLLIKLLYLINVIGQFFLLNRFIDTKYSFWGVQILMDLIQGREWEDSGHFPRVTLCDFDVRVLGNVHHHTVQCVLMINMFNEKIYILVWFWLLVVAAVTALNLLYWLLSTIPGSSNARTIHKYLRISHDFEDGMHDRRTVSRFIKSALRPDGVLVLRFISGHAGDLVATELTGILWKDFAKKLLTQVECRRGHGSPADSDTTKSTTPGDDAGFTEDLYDPPPKKRLDESLTALMPSAPIEHNGYPGPPPTLRTAKIQAV